MARVRFKHSWGTAEKLYKSEAIDSFGNKYLLGVYETVKEAEKAFDEWNKEHLGAERFKSDLVGLQRQKCGEALHCHVLHFCRLPQPNPKCIKGTSKPAPMSRSPSVAGPSSRRRLLPKTRTLSWVLKLNEVHRAQATNRN